MSKIQKELSAATGVKIERKEDRQAFIIRLMLAVGALKDAEWEELSQEAQDWFNEAADAQNAKKKVLPDFPDFEAEEEEAPAKEEAKTTSRRGAKAVKDERLTKVGDTATVLTKRGKSFTGKVVELDDEVIVLDCDGKDEEFDMARVESITMTNGGGKVAKDEDETPAGPGVGDDVVLITKRGKEFSGIIVEMDEEVVVLDVDGKDEEFDIGRVESIKMAGKKAAKSAPAKEEPKATRRGAAKDDAADEEKAPKRSSNEGISIGTRIKELIAEDLDATEADIAKQLKKEGLEFKENTLKLNYADAQKFIVILRAAKLLK